MSTVKSATRYSADNNTRTLAKKPSANHVDFGSMVRKLIDTKKGNNPEKAPKLLVAADFVAEDLKRNAKKGSSGFSGLQKKLLKGSFGSSVGAKRGEESSKKALSEVKSNARTLAMVLRSERELLSLNKEQEEMICQLKILLEERNQEVEKLKDLCLIQKEEIKSLKSALLFPDVISSSLEMKQAKMLIPDLQKQVTSLTGQLQSLAEDVAEVKADKYGGRGYSNTRFSPSYDQDDDNSLFDQEEDYMTPKSEDGMSLKDFNPCLTPPFQAKSNELRGNESTALTLSSRENRISASHGKVSKSTEQCRSSKGPRKSKDSHRIF